MANVIKVGIIGAGRIGKIHAGGDRGMSSARQGPGLPGGQSLALRPASVRRFGVTQRAVEPVVVRCTGGPDGAVARITCRTWSFTS
jgi:hypothetical protein